MFTPGKLAAVGVAAVSLAAPAAAGASEYNAGVLGDGPTLYWQLDEVSGDVVDNAASSDGSGDGVVAGASVLGGPGAFSLSPRAATLQGTALISTSTPAPGRALAVEAWIKPAAAGSGTFLRYANAFELGFNAKRKLTVSIAGGAAKDTRVGLPLNRWTQVNVSFNTGTGADAQVFTNGGGWRVKTVRNAGVVPSLPMGAVTLGGGIGGIDELATFPTALTQTQARSHYLRTGLPVSTARPVISGQPQSGQMLTASPATWSNATSAGVQWQRCDTADTTTSACDDIPGATSAAYVVQDADVGSFLALTETSTNANGTGAVDALPVGPVSALSSPVPVVPVPNPDSNPTPGDDPNPTPAGSDPGGIGTIPDLGASGGSTTTTSPPASTTPTGTAAPACRTRLTKVPARRLAVKRAGRLTVTVAQATNNTFTVAVKAAAVTRKRLARITFRLDRRTLKGASRMRRTVVTSRLTPGKHTLAITIAPRVGKRRTVTIPLRVTPC